MTGPAVGFGELLAQPGVVEVLDLRSTFGFCAFHGGNLERFTDQIASEAAARAGASFYGVLQPAPMRQHVPSKFVSPAESPQLSAFLDHCEVVVALHGYGLRKRWTDVLLGGTNRPLAAHVARHLRHGLPAYRIIDDLDAIPVHLRGQHPDNPCNFPVRGGVQIELPPRVRGLSPLAEQWPANLPHTRRFAHTEHLINALTRAALAWPGGAGQLVPSASG